MAITITPFFDKASSTISYLVVEQATHAGAIIDPVLDFDAASGQVSYDNAQAMLSAIREQEVDLQWILETHTHADHLTSAQFFKQHCQAKHAVSRGITTVQKTFAQLLALEIATDGSQFDQLLDDGDVLALGESTITILATPGHTPCGASFIIADNVFVGDTMFMPDSGTARCDFPNGSAAQLFASIAKINSLPDDTVMWMCHDYQPNGRELAYKTSVIEQKSTNSHLKDITEAGDYIDIREQRDAKLNVPKLLYPSIQVNVNAGILPTANASGQSFLKIPLSIQQS